MLNDATTLFSCFTRSATTLNMYLEVIEPSCTTLVCGRVSQAHGVEEEAAEQAQRENDHEDPRRTHCHLFLPRYL